MRLKTARQFLKCPTCGHNVVRSVFTRGALGHSLLALKQLFVGRANGDNGGGLVWERRLMTHEEVEHVARAVAAASERIVERLEKPLPGADPVKVLASIDTNEELERIGTDWITEAEDELTRRKKLVADELERRIQGSP